jgi:hypothetical protein
MDGRTKLGEFYIVDCNDTSNEDNVENSNEIMNDTKGWDEDEIVLKLNNIATTINELVTIKADVDHNNND